MKHSIKVIFLLIFLVSCPACREQIVHDLSESEANRLLSGLHQIQINSEKEKQSDGRWCVTVAKADTIRAIQYINDARMLPEISSGIESKSSMISSREDQRFRFERALSREIERTLSTIDGILEARVHLNLPPRDPLFGELIKNAESGSASVLLIADIRSKVDENQVRLLVSGAAGVDRQKISVLISKSIAEKSLLHRPAEKMVAAQESESVQTAAATAAKGYLSSKQTVNIWSLLNSTWFQVLLSTMIVMAGLSYSLLNGRSRKRKKLAAIAEQFQTRKEDPEQ